MPLLLRTCCGFESLCPLVGGGALGTARPKTGRGDRIDWLFEMLGLAGLSRSSRWRFARS